MKCNAKLRSNYFSGNVSVLAVVFRRQIKKPTILPEIVGVFLICRQNTTASMETFTEKELERNFTLHFTSYLSIAFSKILPQSKTIKNSKKLSVFGKTTLVVYVIVYKLIFFKTLIIFLKPAIKLITFEKVIIILIMTAQVLFPMLFSIKTRTLMPLNSVYRLFCIRNLK